jgi:hypothetical protein
VFFPLACPPADFSSLDCLIRSKSSAKEAAGLHYLQLDSFLVATPVPRRTHPSVWLWPQLIGPTSRVTLAARRTNIAGNARSSPKLRCRPRTQARQTCAADEVPACRTCSAGHKLVRAALLPLQARTPLDSKPARPALFSLDSPSVSTQPTAAALILMRDRSVTLFRFLASWSSRCNSGTGRCHDSILCICIL